jgi:hypothetical protein
MHRLVTAAVLVGLWFLALATVDAQEEKPPTIKQIMDKLNKGQNALCPTLGNELRADDPPWDQVQQGSKEFASLAAALLKNRPPKGEEADWQKLAKAYADHAKALDEAATQRDAKAVRAALARLADMKACSACHTVHRN